MKKDLIINAIREIGYNPQIDDDGDIFFRFQMKIIFIMSSNDDEDKYASALLPQFAEVDEENVLLNLAACNKVTRETKMAKVFIDQTLKNISASCEFFFTDEDSLKTNLIHSLNILAMIRTVYNNTLTEFSQEQ